jgi:hypothetical protein
MLLIDFLQSLANLILGLFVLRWVQVQLNNRSADSDFNKALGYLLH